jgi:acyl carrier protein
MSSEKVVLSVLAEVSGKPEAGIEPQMDLVADLGIDSPKALQLLVELEERLEIEIDDEDAAGLETVEDVLSCAARLTGSGA